MKRLWIALALLALLCAAALSGAAALRRTADGLGQLLSQAQAAAQAQDWARAEALTAQAQRDWAGRSGVLHVLLRHGDIDEISLGFQETWALLECRELGEYTAANARLMVRLRLLWEAEQLSVQNLF